MERANELVLEAVSQLHQLSPAIGQDAVAPHLPHRSLLTELETIVAKDGPWLEQRQFADAVRRLRPVVAAIETPLVFTNGDYNPGNFLSDGTRLTGLIDFSLSCFEDPHASFALYGIYDWGPFYQAGIVERCLADQGLTRRDFAPRLALRSLRTLRREVPATGGISTYRSTVLKLLEQALRDLP